MADKKFELMTIEELEQVRGEAQQAMGEAKKRFELAGQVLDQKRQLAEKIDRADRLKKVADAAEAEVANIRGQI